MQRNFQSRTGMTPRTTTYGTNGTTNYGSHGTTKFPAEDPTENMRGTSFNPLPFDAKKAPTPDLCLLKFVQAASTATKLEDLMNYIPYAELRTLKGCQKNYDPALAAQKRAKYQAEGMKQDGIDHLTSSPFDNELKRLKRIALKIMRVRKIKYTASNKAELDIATHNCQATQNGVLYPYGTADVEMLGEEGYWRMQSYNDSNVNYKEPQ